MSMAEKKARRPRFGHIKDFDEAEWERTNRPGYKWNVRHCNGRFCSAEQMASGGCTGGCDGPSGAERRQHRRISRRAEWDAYEQSAYDHAEDATRGNMQRRGARGSVLGIFWPKGRRPWRAASHELGEYWDGGGMVPITFTEFEGGKRRPAGRPWQDTTDRRPRKKAAAKKAAPKKRAAPK